MSEITPDTAPENRPADALAVVTFADLQDRIRVKMERANRPESRDAWQSLLEIVKDLIGSSTSGGIDAVTGRHWSLAQVQVAGYQGIGGDPSLQMTIDPTPGITVIHGPNGSGKSSLADAIDAVMHGKAGGSSPAIAGNGGKAPLWDRVQCGRDADRATIELTLVDGADRLHLSGVIDSHGKMTSWTAEHESAGKRKPVHLDTGWASALAGHQPVFAYGALERRIQTSGQLQTYLDLLIALGGCFVILDEEVNRRSAAADEALAAWKVEKSAAQLAVEEVDASRSGGEPLPDLSWPEIADDPDVWQQAEQLTEEGQALPEIGADLRDAVAIAAASVATSLDRLDTARISTLERVADCLAHLHEEARELDDPGQTCPVCLTEEVDWRSVLAESVDAISHISGLSSAAAEAVLGLKSAGQKGLSPLFAVASSAPDPSLVDQRNHGVRLLQDFMQATEHSVEPTASVVSIARPLAEWCQSEGCRRLFDHAIETSDRRRQWLRDRHSAVTRFLEVWRTQKVDALQKGLWDATKRHLATLANELRDERASQLQERAGMRISALLHDAGIELKSIEISKTKADLVLRDSSGTTMKLGMLSSGQRNAVLLAPLLALTTGGPFGFVVLDDPVHAFDGLRVDRLAAIVAEIAVTRRVVVLTHDERLREHLLAVSSDAKAYQISRDHSSGVVTLTSGRPMWEILLDDACNVLATTGTSTETLGTTDIVRGLCRQALDDALRGYVVRIATRSGADVETALSTLDAAATTRRRLDETASLAGVYAADSSQVTRATALVDPHLDDWNAAAHGNPPKSSAVTSEIQAARRACQQLTHEAPR